MTKYFSLLLIGFCVHIAAYAQSSDDATFINTIFEYSLKKGKAHTWLTELCTEAGPRIGGSPAYDRAVKLTQTQLKSVPGVSTYTQDVEVNYWYRGSKEIAEIFYHDGRVEALNTLALGNSVETGLVGITAEVIEVTSLDEVSKLGRDKIKDKIVFFNRPMDAGRWKTFNAYGGAVDQRVYGASRAAEYGAIAVLVRSMTSNIDDYPHTGTLVYQEGLPKIPAFAISTLDAEHLHGTILDQPSIKVHLRSNCQDLGTRNSPNVIGEIRGSLYPDKVIVIGGHLDAWDVAQGAHDDGAGCVHAMDVLHILQAINYKPKYTIRCVLFSNEENGLKGGTAYAERVIKNKEVHIAAIESDAGGFSPRSFSFDADTSVLKKFYKKVNDVFLPYFEPYQIIFELGGSGADIGPLKPTKGLLVGLRPDSQRYFDYHHTEVDTIDNVHPRELKMGSAAITSLVYLIDKYGL